MEGQSGEVVDALHIINYSFIINIIIIKEININKLMVIFFNVTNLD